jgi:AbrB family looped-hinge helix DNA binding protein
MSAAGKLITTLSTKGQLILPREIRRQRRWEAGTRLVVQDTPRGVLLTSAQPFPTTKPGDVFGSLRYRGAPKSLADMHAGIAAEARRRHARG